MTEQEATEKWNAEADEFNQWDSLGEDEKQDLIREKSLEHLDFIQKMGITLLDKKWLDPECHKSCKSLVLKNRIQELENFVQLVANGKRPDGTYNYCREALERKAKEIANPPVFHQEYELKFVESKRLDKCDGCDKMVDIKADNTKHDGCDFIYGRRGWRQLGAYDG